MSEIKTRPSWLIWEEIQSWLDNPEEEIDKLETLIKEYAEARVAESK